MIGLPDRKWTERVTAVVIPRSGADISEKEIIDFCGNTLPAFKRPKQVIFITYDEMPRTGSGKVLHRVLREKYGTKRDG